VVQLKTQGPCFFRCSVRVHGQVSSRQQHIVNGSNDLTPSVVVNIHSYMWHCTCGLSLYTYRCAVVAAVIVSFVTSAKNVMFVSACHSSLNSRSYVCQVAFNLVHLDFCIVVLNCVPKTVEHPEGAEGGDRFVIKIVGILLHLGFVST